MEKSVKYTPVACDLVDQIEILATKRKKITITYLKDSDKQQVSDIIKTWYTKDKEEFLETMSGLIIRLDRLIAFDDQELTDLSRCKIK